MLVFRKIGKIKIFVSLRIYNSDLALLHRDAAMQFITDRLTMTQITLPVIRKRKLMGLVSIIMPMISEKNCSEILQPKQMMAVMRLLS